jgi:hypothetical protein
MPSKRDLNQYFIIIQKDHLQRVKFYITYVVNQQGRYLFNLWQQLSSDDRDTLNDFKLLITGHGEELHLSEENLSNWLLLENELSQEFENRPTNDTDHTILNSEFVFGGNEIIKEYISKIL